MISHAYFKRPVRPRASFCSASAVWSVLILNPGLINAHIVRHHHRRKWRKAKQKRPDLLPPVPTYFQRNIRNWILPHPEGSLLETVWCVHDVLSTSFRRLIKFTQTLIFSILKYFASNRKTFKNHFGDAEDVGQRELIMDGSVILILMHASTVPGSPARRTNWPEIAGGPGLAGAY